MKKNFFSSIKIKSSISRLMLTVFILFIVIVSGTFAWLTFRSNKSALVLTIGDVNKTQITLTPYQLNVSLIPSTQYDENVYTDVIVTNERDDDTTITLFYKVNDSTNYQGDLNYMIVSKNSSASDEVVIPSEENIVSSGKITLLDSNKDRIIMNTSVSASVDNLYYRVYVWADAIAGDNSSAQGSQVSLELNATIASVTISGDNQYKEVLTTSIEDSIVSSLEQTYSYQWYYKTSIDAEPVAIAGATSSTYTIQSGLVGTYIYVEVTANGNYSEALVYSDITNEPISPIAQSLSVDFSNIGTYNGNSVSLPVTTNSDGELEIIHYIGSGCSSMTTTSVGATYAGGAPADAGNYSVNVLLAGSLDKNGDHYKIIDNNGNVINGESHGNDYGSSTTGCRSYSITKKSIVPSIVASDKTYDGNSSATCSISFDGVVSGDTVNASIGSCTFANANAGNSKTVTATGITLTGTDALNYSTNTSASTSANINKKSIVPSLVASDKIYDGSDSATCSTSVSGVLSGDIVNPSVGTCLFIDKNVGNSKIVAGLISISGTDAGNYMLSSTTIRTTANITAKSVAPSITASDKSYDGTTTATCTGSLSEMFETDTVEVSVGSCLFDSVDAASGITVTGSNISISGTDAANYTLSSTTATTSADITKATNKVTIICASGLKYNGSAQELISSASATSGTIYYSTFNKLTASNYNNILGGGSTKIPTKTNAGRYTVYYYVPESTNYREASGSRICTISE